MVFAEGSDVPFVEAEVGEGGRAGARDFQRGALSIHRVDGDLDAVVCRPARDGAGNVARARREIQDAPGPRGIEAVSQVVQDECMASKDPIERGEVVEIALQLRRDGLIDIHPLAHRRVEFPHARKGDSGVSRARSASMRPVRPCSRR